MYDPDLAINEQYEEIEQLKINLDEERRLREKLADLLERTANALKGPPAYLYSHDWSDLPKVATQLRDENWALRELCIQLRGLTDEQIDALLRRE
jgi:hypothetical protein